MSAAVDGLLLAPAAISTKAAFYIQAIAPGIARAGESLVILMRVTRSSIAVNGAIHPRESKGLGEVVLADLPRMGQSLPPSVEVTRIRITINLDITTPKGKVGISGFARVSEGANVSQGSITTSGSLLPRTGESLISSVLPPIIWVEVTRAGIAMNGADLPRTGEVGLTSFARADEDRVIRFKVAQGSLAIPGTLLARAGLPKASCPYSVARSLG